jgi:hypothetical protein
LVKWAGEEMIKQGSVAWHKQKNGKIGSSNIHKLMGNAKKEGALCAAALTYCNELACDIIIGEPKEDEFTSRDMERGLELEPIAVDAFEYYMEKLNPADPVTCSEVGFITHPNQPRYGASLDSKVSDGGILEIKCRQRKGHLEQFLIFQKLEIGPFLTKAEDTKIATFQRQWGMFCTGSTHSYFVGYTDELKLEEGGLLVKRFERDEELIEKMAEKAALALIEIDRKVAEYREAIQELMA